MKNIYKALSDFQQECPAIVKSTEGYGYTYADLPTIYETILPLLKKNGLGFTQILKDDGIETVLFHIETGEEIKGFAKIPTGVTLAKMNVYQVMGSAYTYYRRYALSAMLGIITETDDDTSSLNETQLPVFTTKVDERPWLEEHDFKQMITAIEEGNGGTVREKMKNYKMKVIYRSKLEAALSKPSPTPLATPLTAKVTESANKEIDISEIPF